MQVSITPSRTRSHSRPRRSPGRPRGECRAILRHIDLVTVDPKQAAEADIAALKSAGILEPDIVRLSELIAFVGYQVRVVKGLRLMAEAA